MCKYYLYTEEPHMNTKTWSKYEVLTTGSNIMKQAWLGARHLPLGTRRYLQPQDLATMAYSRYPGYLPRLGNEIPTIWHHQDTYQYT